jgi:hypothetical protein
VRKALITGTFLWCAVARADETSTILTPSDLEVIRHKVEGNWNVPLSDDACSEMMVFRIDLGTGGTVEEVKLLDPEPLPQVCQATADSAERAIWKSSPLPVPEGVVMLQLNFDPTKLQ